MSGINASNTNVTLNADQGINIGAVQIQDPTGTQQATVATSSADGSSDTSNRLATSSRLKVFNGTTWDRLRSGYVTAQTTFVGFLNTISMGRYNATAPTLSDGNMVPVQLDVAGNQKVVLASQIAGEDLANDILKTEVRASFLNITTNATTTVKSGAGVLYGFTVNNNGFTTAGTITVYDNTAASGTKIGTWTIPLEPPGTVALATVYVPPQLGLNASFATGLTFVTATTAPAADITVLYR